MANYIWIFVVCFEQFSFSYTTAFTKYVTDLFVELRIQPTVVHEKLKESFSNLLTGGREQRTVCNYAIFN